MENDLKKCIRKDEKIIWEGHSDKKCFMFECWFNPLLPFVIVWIAVDFLAIALCIAGDAKIPVSFLIGFLLVFSFPIWLYIGKIVFSGREYRNQYYIITNKGVYSSRGVFSPKFKYDPYLDITDMKIHQSTFDKKFNTADIMLVLPGIQYTNSPKAIVNWKDNAGLEKTIIFSIPNYQEVYNLMLRAQNEARNNAINQNGGYTTMINSMRRFL